MKKVFIIILVITSKFANAQNVGIGVSNPQNKLHVGGGFRLDTLTGVGGSGLVWHNPSGVVYGIKFTGNTSDVLRGDGTFGSYSGTGNVGWLLNGNSGTNPANNFIGTIDDQPLAFKVNNVRYGWLGKNTFFGKQAGQSTLTYSNVAIGNGALFSNTNRAALVAVGDSALFNNKGTISEFDGTRAFNTALGYKSLFSNTTGQSNTATGYLSLYNNTTGHSNIANGPLALYSNTTGIDNIAIGRASLYANTSGFSNIAVGDQALIDNTTGVYNTAIGNDALLLNTTGTRNVGIGAEALSENVLGSENTAVGTGALRSSEGSRNTAIGFFAMGSSPNSADNIAVGSRALNKITGSYNTATGINALASSQFAQKNSAYGYQTLFSNTTGSENAAFGTTALFSNTTGNNNTAVGQNSLYNNNGSFNSSLGYNAMFSLVAGTNNTAVGQGAMYSLTTGHWNTAIGVGSGPTVDNVLNTTCLGFQSRINISNAMSFGSTLVNRWVFGRPDITAGVFQVGSNLTNGNGAYLTAAGVWFSTSDQNAKENFTELDKKELLEKISTLRITRWNFKGPEKETHIGPMAQQFKQLFNLGIEGNDKSISTIDPAGIALAGIQELNKQVKEQQATIEKQQKLIDELLKRLTALENK